MIGQLSDLLRQFELERLEVKVTGLNGHAVVQSVNGPLAAWRPPCRPC